MGSWLRWLIVEMGRCHLKKEMDEDRPADWKRVQNRWLEGIPDMQHPDVNMKKCTETILVSVSG